MSDGLKEIRLAVLAEYRDDNDVECHGWRETAIAGKTPWMWQRTRSCHVHRARLGLLRCHVAAHRQVRYTTRHRAGWLCRGHIGAR